MPAYNCCVDDAFVKQIKAAKHRAENEANDKILLYEMMDYLDNKAKPYAIINIIMIVFVLGILLAILFIEGFYENVLGGTVGLLAFHAWSARDYFSVVIWPRESLTPSKIRVRVFGNAICALVAIVYIFYTANLLIHCSDPNYLATHPWTNTICTQYEAIPIGFLVVAGVLVIWDIAISIFDWSLQPTTMLIYKELKRIREKRRKNEELV